MAEFINVLAETELPVGSKKAVVAFGKSVLLCHSAEGIFAIKNECTHQQVALEGGRLRGCAIFCPEHGVRFDLRTGSPAGTLTDKPVECFEVRIVGGNIEIAEREGR